MRALNRIKRGVLLAMSMGIVLFQYEIFLDNKVKEALALRERSDYHIEIVTKEDFKIVDKDEYEKMEEVLQDVQKIIDDSSIEDAAAKFITEGENQYTVIIECEVYREEGYHILEGFRGNKVSGNIREVYMMLEDEGEASMKIKIDYGNLREE